MIYFNNTRVCMLHVLNQVYNYRNMLIMSVCGSLYLICTSWSLYALQFDVCKHSHVMFIVFNLPTSTTTCQYF